MRDFVFSYPVKVYFGTDAARKAISQEMGKYGKTVMVAYGGGSVIDCCKIISAQAKTEKDIWEMEFTEHVFPADFVPMGAVVTAAGTGAEMNNGAVITHEEKKIKTGVLGAIASFAVLEPEHMATLPAKQVVSGAFDTLSHCMETYCKKLTRDEIFEILMECR